MKNQNKLVSVILNCYNGEKYLKDSLKSIVKQTYKNWELIFWDNRSSDLSKTIMKSFKNKKFKYFLSKRHTSLYAARNLAISKAKGAYISFIDADDVWETDKLHKQVKLFKDKKVAVVYGNSWLKKEISNKKKIFIKYKMKNGYIYNDLIKSYNVGILTAVIKKSFLKKMKKIFNDNYDIIGDFDLFIKLSKKYKFDVIQEPVATYRIHEKNLSLLKKETEINEFKDWLKNNRKKLSKENLRLINKKILHLEYINTKFKKNFLITLFFLIKNKNQIFNIKNLIILLLPKIILKKIMWFY